MFSINIIGGIPIYEQLSARITELISSGVIQEDERLPAVREVAKELGVNPNTVQKSYQILEQKGLIYSIPAKGSYVAKSEKTILIVQEKALGDFSESAKSALKLGIPLENLHTVLDTISI